MTDVEKFGQPFHRICKYEIPSGVGRIWIIEDGKKGKSAINVPGTVMSTLHTLFHLIHTETHKAGFITITLAMT